MKKNWVGGNKNQLLRKILVGLPTLAGAYLGWKHGRELAEYASNVETKSEIFYHQIATTTPLIAKLAGACLEAKITNTLGKIFSGIIEKISERFKYKTGNTNSLNEDFDPLRPYRRLATLEKAEYEELVESFILDARKNGRFRAQHINPASKGIGLECLEDMINKEYIKKEERLGVEVVSPTRRALYSMFGCDKHHESVLAPFGPTEGKKIKSK